ncbi:MAG: hypothetical protein ACYC9L_16540 [Sulfuricaulis sp.]
MFYDVRQHPLESGEEGDRHAIEFEFDALFLGSADCDMYATSGFFVKDVKK